LQLSTAHCSRPRSGETANGDRAYLRTEGSRGLHAVIDALGHGPAAEHAALVAVRELDAVTLDEPLDAIARRVHAVLRGTRGAAMTILLHDEWNLGVLSIGNVAIRSMRGAKVSILPVAGVLGGVVRAFRVAHTVLVPGTRLVLHSDGVSGRFDEELCRGPAHEIAARLVRDRGASHDDATVLVLDFD
jgi:hypothetical protein